MNAHLLTLADLHAAAPGILDVVFGADGDFLLAPMFRPPIWHADGYWVWTYTVDDLVSLPVALDLRIPSVAARLAGLCAKAMHGSHGSWTVLWLPECPGFALMGHVVLQGIPTTMGWWWSEKGGRAGSMTFMGMGPPVRIHGATSIEHFLAALTLTLAPRIAALKDAK